MNEFRGAILDAGLSPPDVIEPGKLHRFPGAGKSNGNTAGWCKLFDDSQGGVYGDWSTGLNETWQAERDKPLTPVEKHDLLRRVAAARKQAEVERQQKHISAAEQAATIWEAATQAESHAYLTTKGINPNGARLHQGTLVIPVRSEGSLQSLQFIYPDGDKKFMPGGKVTGGYFSIGKPKGAKALCLAEGFATGATIHQATGYPVAIAFNAGNLESVAKAMRERFPELPLIVCADDDVQTKDNPGKTKAQAAARAIGGSVAMPAFGSPRPVDVTDFNDMAVLLGLEAVADAIHASVPVGETVMNDQADGGIAGDWPDPQAIVTTHDSMLYPLDALPDTLQAAVQEVLEFTKVPIPLAASSALAALSLAAQANTDVKRSEKLTGPGGLFLLTIANSGERKSTCDKFFTKVIRDYESEQAATAKPLRQEHSAEEAAWTAKHSGIKDKIRAEAKKGKPVNKLEEDLLDHERNKPEPPRVPRLIYGDVTPEQLKWALAKTWPSAGVISSEAGIVFGSHGMGKDSVMRNLAALNQMWDGTVDPVDRRTSESFSVPNSRLTMALQVQEATLQSFFERSGTLARGSGFLARFLIAWPKSTQGTRLYTEPQEDWPALKIFNQRITELLEQAVCLGDDGGLSPSLLNFSVKAKAAWVSFHDTIEKELAPGKDLEDVRDVASKIADNAARIAALFQRWEDSNSTEIGLKAFKGAARLAEWHLYEARRFFGELALPKELATAVKLERWLLRYCQDQQVNKISRRDLQQNVTPTTLRQGKLLNEPLAKLQELGRIREIKDGKKKDIYINPVLIEISSVCNNATATHATDATHRAEKVVTVASVATVAVAPAQSEKTEPTAQDSDDKDFVL